MHFEIKITNSHRCSAVSWKFVLQLRTICLSWSLFWSPAPRRSRWRWACSLKEGSLPWGGCQSVFLQKVKQYFKKKIFTDEATNSDLFLFLRFEVWRELIQIGYTEDTYNTDGGGFPDVGEDGGDDHWRQGSTCCYQEKLWVPFALKKIYTANKIRGW